MTKTEQLLFEKLKELIDHLSANEIINEITWADTWEKLKSEIATLEAEMAEQKEINTTSEYCQCLEPDRESGYSYCMRCHKHVSNQRMEQLTRDIEVTNEQKPVNSAEKYENEVFEYLVDSGKTIDDNLERFTRNNAGIISGRIKKFASQTDLREELLKFDIDTYRFIHTEETSKRIVDKYLKTMKPPKDGNRN